MAIDFPSSPTNGQIHTDAEGREYVWINALSRWQGNGGHAQAALTKPLAAVNGEIYFNPTTKEFEVWDDSNSNWMTQPSSSPPYTEASISLSGTSATLLFQSIPSTAKEIKIKGQPLAPFNSGEYVRIRVGTSSGIVSSGYWFTRALVDNAGVNAFGTRTNTGWDFFPVLGPNAIILSMTLTKVGSTGNMWTMECSFGSLDSNQGGTMSGAISLVSPLDRIQITGSGTGGVYYGTVSGSNPEVRIYYK